MNIKELLIKKIEALPPLPKSVLELEEFRMQKDKDIPQLLEIIEKDPLIISNLLKTANSSIFSFKSSVDSPSRAVNLLGMNFTISIALGSVVHGLIETNLDSYDATIDDFMQSCNISTQLVRKWVGQIDPKLRDELFIPAFLQGSGKFIVSDLIKEYNLVDDFKLALSGVNTSETEHDFLGLYSSELTAIIFKHWLLGEGIYVPIAYSDKITKCPKAFRKKAEILNIINMLTDITSTLNQKNIDIAIGRAEQYGLSSNQLRFVIDDLKSDIEDKELG